MAKQSKLKLIRSLFKVKRTFGGNQEEIPVPVSMTDEQIEVLRERIKPGKSIQDIIRENSGDDIEIGDPLKKSARPDSEPTL